MKIAALLGLICSGVLNAQPHAIDTAKSTLTVHVYKAGMLGALGHDHTIAAPVASGTVDVQGHKVELRVNSAALKVEDTAGAEKDRDQVQATMVGPEVLNTGEYKEIQFKSTGAESAGAGAWKVSGELTLHGTTRPVSVDVHEKDGRYTGACRLNITEFGIKPVKVAGGTIRVKDEVQIDFDIQLAR